MSGIFENKDVTSFEFDSFQSLPKQQVKYDWYLCVRKRVTKSFPTVLSVSSFLYWLLGDHNRFYSAESIYVHSCFVAWQPFNYSAITRRHSGGK
jgi:hypothetical protein